MDAPGISIITVIRNGRDIVGRTLDSVATLRWPKIQHIFIDGESTDGTVDFIRQQASRIDYLVSEPDDGLYDAMNKGLTVATEEYVWFLNAGDSAYEPGVLERAFAGPKRPDLLYGNAMLTRQNGRDIGLRRGGVPQELTWRNFRFGMVVCHQAMIVRRAVAAPFALRWRHVADIQWAMDALKRCNEVKFVEGAPLCRFLVGGRSARYKIPALMERFRLLQERFGLLPNLIVHSRIVCRRTWQLFRRK